MDIGFDTNTDLMINDGDFSIVESTGVHQQQLILSTKGEFKQHPTVGVGVFEYFDDEEKLGISRAVSIEFSRDGMDVTKVEILPNGILNTIAMYK